MLDERESEKIVLGSIIRETDKTFGIKEVSMLNEEHFELKEEKIVFDIFKRAFSTGLSGVNSFVTVELNKIEYPADRESAKELTREYWNYSKRKYDKRTLSFHAKVLIEKLARKKMIELSEKINENAKNLNLEVSDIMASIETGVANLAFRTEDERILSAEELSQRKMDEIDRKANLKEDAFIRTGFKDFDSLLPEGLTGSQLTVLGARPAMGKSAFALNIAKAVAKQGKGVLFISLEMGVFQIADRMLAEVSQMPLSTVKQIHLHVSDNNGKIFRNAINSFAKIPFFLAEGAGNFEEVVSMIRQMTRKHKVKVVVIDYLQLMKSGQSKWMNRNQEVGLFSRTLKLLSKELDIHIIALSQLSREVEKRADKRPLMADLRESGEIEQDSDNIILLFRENYYLPKEERIMYDNGWSETVEVIVAKQREGETGMTKLKFFGAQQRFDVFKEGEIQNEREEEIIDNSEFPF